MPFVSICPQALASFDQLAAALTAAEDAEDSALEALARQQQALALALAAGGAAAMRGAAGGAAALPAAPSGTAAASGAFPPAAASGAARGGSDWDAWWRRCRAVLGRTVDSLGGHRDVFYRPPNHALLTDYHRLVPRPLCLRVVVRRLARGSYADAPAFFEVCNTVELTRCWLF